MKLKKAFTLVELIIGITITVFILGGVMLFISNIYSEINYAIKKIDTINKISKIENKIKEINSIYSSGIILVDNETGTGSDILLFRKQTGEDTQNGYIFAQLNYNTKLVDGSGNINYIDNKVLGYREISENELIELDLNPDKIYEYTFHLDNLFKGLTLKNFQVEFYNSGKIGKIDISTFINFNKDKKNIKYSEIDNSEIKKYTFNF